MKQVLQQLQQTMKQNNLSKILPYIYIYIYQFKTRKEVVC